MSWSEWSKTVNIYKEGLLEMINFCFDSSYFKFNGKFYKQLDGSSMGNPSCPVLASLVMNHIITEAEKNLKFDLKLMNSFFLNIVHWFI